MRARQSPLAEPLVMLATVLQWLVLALATGAVVGTASSAFLRLLFLLAGRSTHAPLWVQMGVLPLAGLLNGLLLYYGYRDRKSRLSDSVIVAVNQQQGHMPWKTLWVKPVAALVTLWGGGSAGKEGPCSHIGGSVAAGIGQLLHLNPEIRKRLVACGVSAGFSSVFGTPIAGAIYGVEMLAIGRVRHDFLFPGIVAGVTSYEVSRFWGVPYPHYLFSFVGSFSEWLFLKTIAIGILCGIAAWLFVEAIRRVEQISTWLRERFSIWPPAMPVIGGCLMAALILVVPTDYLGLSLPVMYEALAGQSVPYLGFVYKIVLVALTLGTGFYGGVVTPQFVIGAVAGGAFAHLLGLQAALGAAVGFCAVVASASNAPVAAIFMGVELFGGSSTLYVAGASVAAWLIIGHRSVYPAQQLAYPKSTWLRARPDAMVGREKVHLSYGLLHWWHDRFSSARPGGRRNHDHDQHPH